MKRLSAIILILSMVISFGGLLTYAEDNIIFFDGFESGADNWITFTEANPDGYKLTSDVAKEGKNSVLVSDKDESSNGGIRLKEIEITPDFYYTASCDIKAVSGTIKLYLRLFDADHKKVASKSAAAKVGDWSILKVTLLAEENAKYADIVVSGSSETAGEAYIDNIRLIKGDAKELPVTAPDTNVDKKGIVYSESFESGLGIWKSYDADTKSNVKVTTEKANDGKQSVSITDELDNKSTGIMTCMLPVIGGTTYTAKADLLSESGNVKMYFRCYDSANNRIDNKSVGVNTNKWSTASLTMDFPDNAAFAEIVITYDLSVTGKAYIDNIQLINEGKLSDNPEKLAQADLQAKINNAKAGDIIEIPDGTYKNLEITISASGEENKPVILKAKNPGKAILTENSSVKMKGSYIIVEGLRFEGCTTTSNHIVNFDTTSSHCQLKECAILECNPKDLTVNQKWVYIQGKYNKVSSCYFRGKTAPGMMAEVIRRTDEANYHTIENCYFGDYKLGGINGLETIRLGTSQQSLSASCSTVSGCFFEACNGEVETISVKSGNNYVVNNTLYNNKGAIVLRHGNGTLVEGNLIIGGEATIRPTGVRVIGEDHIVKNNYMINLPKDSVGIYISDGNPNPLIDEYLEVKNLIVANNTIIGADANIVAGEYLPSANNASNRILPPEGKVTDNVVISYKGKNPLIYNGDINHKLTFSGNITFGKALGYMGDAPSGIEYKNPVYTKNGSFISFENGKGADISVVSKAPKSPFDVMPKWVKEELYDTNVYKFEPVSGDPFNTDFDTLKYLTLPDKVNVMLNGIRKEFDVDAEIINGRTMVPMRAIFEDFGANVAWDDSIKTATAATASTVVKITNDSEKAYVNGKEVILDSPATIINGRFLVPLRFVSEAFGADVGWNGESRAAIINYSIATTGGVSGEFINTHGKENALTIYGIVIGGFNEEGNEVTNAFDSDITTKWTSKKDDNGIEAYGIFDLSSVKALDKIYIAFGTGNKRNYGFSLSVSDDNINYTPVLTEVKSSGTSLDLEEFDLKGAKGRYIKITGHGNQDNAWNNYNEIVITEKK